MQKYKITSKMKPSKVLMRISCDDFEESKKRQLFLLSHSMHPNTDMQNHLLKFGIRDFDFIPEDFIERAIIVPEKETRNKRGRQKV